MSHFAEGQWADFVRGLGDERQRLDMETHIAGCRTCQRIRQAMECFFTVAQSEAAYQPPEYAVRRARAIYALREPETVWILPRIVARLVYDSFREPLPAGLRSRHQLTRHALYEADNYSLDIRLEQQQGSPRVTLVGQIADRVNPRNALAEVAIYLVSDKTIVGRTLSNSFGEFQLEYNPAKRLHLYVHAAKEPDARIDVELSGLERNRSRRRTEPKEG